MSQSPTTGSTQRFAVLPFELFEQVVAFIAQKHTYAEVSGMIDAIKQNTAVKHEQDFVVPQNTGPFTPTDPNDPPVREIEQ